jgi:hypothetical protein
MRTKSESLLPPSFDVLALPTSEASSPPSGRAACVPAGRAPQGRKAGHARGAPGPAFAHCRGGETVTNFEISFPLHFQSFQVPGIGILRAPMLPSNRRYACTIKIQRPFRPPSLRTHRPTRHRIHHDGHPNSRLPHLRRRAEDRPVCVTKSPAIPATPSRKGTYPPTRNTLNSRILRHNSPSPGRFPRFAEASLPHHSRLTSLIPLDLHP